MIIVTIYQSYLKLQKQYSARIAQRVLVCTGRKGDAERENEPVSKLQVDFLTNKMRQW